MMPRRAVNAGSSRRFGVPSAAQPFGIAAVHQKTRSSPLISACLLLVGAILLLGYTFSGPGFHYSSKHDGDERQRLRLSKHGLSLWEFMGKESYAVESIDDDEGDFSSLPECRSVACQAIPLLKEVYGKSMNHVLHIGPGTCGVTLKLVKEEKLEAWGIQPFDMKPPLHSICDSLIRKSLIRVSEVHRPLPYKGQSFSLILATNTLENLTGKQLNTTLPELARVSRNGFVLFIKMKAIQSVSNNFRQAKGEKLKIKKPRNKLWWQHRFEMLGLQENEKATKAFENLRSAKSFRPDYYIFHLISKNISSGDDTSLDSIDGDSSTSEV